MTERERFEATGGPWVRRVDYNREVARRVEAERRLAIIERCDTMNQPIFKSTSDEWERILPLLPHMAPGDTGAHLKRAELLKARADKAEAEADALRETVERVKYLPRECSDTMPHGVVRGELIDAALASRGTCPTCGCSRENRGPSVDYNPESEPPPALCADSFHSILKGAARGDK